MSEHTPLTEAETACLDCGHPARLHWPVLGGVFDGCLGMVGERSCRCPVARAPHDTSERRKARYWRNVRRDAVEEGYIDERRVANLAARTSTATADRQLPDDKSEWTNAEADAWHRGAQWGMDHIAATADTGLRERVEALVTEWESTVYKLAAGYPLTTDEFVTFWFKQPLRAILDATAAPTTDTGARDE